MIFKAEPADFNKKYDVVCCFATQGEKILLLQRQPHKPQGNQWGFPAGKCDGNEPLLDAVQRELYEETGLQIDKKDFLYLGKAYTRYPEYDFIFHMYRAHIDFKQTVKISPGEHQNFIWIPLREINKLNLMEDLEECIKNFYK